MEAASHLQHAQVQKDVLDLLVYDSSDFLNSLSLINVVYEGRWPSLSQCQRMLPILYSLITRGNQFNVNLVLETTFF